MKQKNENREEFFTALDVGSSKVLCLVARPGAEPGSLRVIGMGDAPSHGIRHGCVVDVQEAVQSIRSALREAGYTANVQLTGVWAAIGGQTLRSANCVGQTVLRGREVTRDDVEQAESNARQAAQREVQAEGGEFLKMIPQGFRCGDVTIERPIGLSGQRLEAFVHALYGSRSNARNLKRCIERAGVELIDYEPHPWAAAKAVLTDTERQCGAALIDIGAQTTSLIVFREGRVRFTDVRPWGADYLTRDIAMVLGISLEQAEALKLRSGECRASMVNPGEIVELETRGELSRPYSRELLVKTLAARVRELFELYRRILADAGALGEIELVTLTGGGAMLPGLAESASAILGRRVRIGCPRLIEGETPLLSRPDAVVAAGLARCALERSVSGAERAYGARRARTFGDRLKTFLIGDY